MKSLTLGLLIIIFGCSENKNKIKADAEKKQPGKIEFINSGDLEKIISDRNGKNLFINVWATWCAPCVEEFPHLVKIAEEYKNKNMDFLSISVDFGKKADSLVADFLSEQNNPDFPVYIAAEKSAEQIIEMLNGEWDGSIPASFIYNTRAVQKSFILGSQDYSFFKNRIESVLNES